MLVLYIAPVVAATFSNGPPLRNVDHLVSRQRLTMTGMNTWSAERQRSGLIINVPHPRMRPSVATATLAQVSIKLSHRISIICLVVG
jgi:hypothetical protein